jgi:hypothetical protein
MVNNLLFFEYLRTNLHFLADIAIILWAKNYVIVCFLAYGAICSIRLKNSKKQGQKLSL